MKDGRMVVAIVVAVAVVAAAGTLFSLGYQTEASSQVSEEVTQAQGSAPQAEVAEDVAEEETTIEEAPVGESSYSGQVIAGSTTPYVRYNVADFEKAREDGKAIYLYYYATWCPICAAERPGIFAAFDELDRDDAVGFEVHFNDGQNTRDDNDVAREYGVFSQHTHVFLDKEGKVAQKTLNPISKEEIKSRILSLAG